MILTWTYWTWDEFEGELMDDDGGRLMDETGRAPAKFGSASEAERYLEEMDIRGSVR